MAWAVIGSAAIAGVSSYLGQRQAESSVKDQIKNEMEAIRVGGDEDRKNLAYQSALARWKQNKQKYRSQQGAKNWTTFGRSSSTPTGYGLNALLTHNSTSGTPDPGAMPLASSVEVSSPGALAALQRTTTTRRP